MALGRDGRRSQRRCQVRRAADLNVVIGIRIGVLQASGVQVVHVSIDIVVAGVRGLVCEVEVSVQVRRKREQSVVRAELERELKAVCAV